MRNILNSNYNKMKNLKLTICLLSIGIFTGTIGFSQGSEKQKTVDHYDMVHTLIAELNGETPKTPSFDGLLKDIIKPDLSESQLYMIIEAANKNFNFYDELIAKGHETTSSLAIIAQQVNNDQKPAGFEQCKVEYMAWKQKFEQDRQIPGKIQSIKNDELDQPPLEK